ncbi:MAG: DUF499 domain-containing protein [Spirochaetales bacterium]|nr:DUF499 domain-containing protein [Spirochaetales bacterium]
MSLKAWREIAIPHEDVLNGTSTQSEFAADLNSVATGKASSEYQDAQTFYSRTYITEGMALLLKNVIMRLNGKGGEPVIQLKTSFGGGKTHSMIAVYHLAKHSCPLNQLHGVSPLLDNLGFNDIPQAQVAVIDGNSLSPGQPWSRGSHQIQTLWGELAWQLGGEEGYKFLEESDKNRTSPGKDLLVSIFTKYGPCVILVDELLAFIRQLISDDTLPAGTFNSNISFIQALTEACKIVPNCILLASLPESESELGTVGAKEALNALEKYFGRVQAIWKPVDTEESFEIVRRRLFKEITDENTKKEVCRAFFDMYQMEHSMLPSETQESAYLERLERAYPIHPQLFDCLYEEWATLDKFQKTRGTLKLLSTVIAALWKQNNTDYFILPSSIPVSDGKVSTELCAVLNGTGWEQVITKDIDGDNSESSKIDMSDSRIGALMCARKVSRSIFMKTSPISNELNTNNHNGQQVKGVASDYILLCCLQPNQNAALYTDAIKKVADKLHYLNISGSGIGADKCYYRFATTANMRKELEDRVSRIKDNDPKVLGLLKDELRRLSNAASFFNYVHPFPETSEVPDDEALRLIYLSPAQYYSTSEELQYAQNAAKEYVKQCGNNMRSHQNRLLFVAPDSKNISLVEQTAKKCIAWDSIIEDAKSGRINLDMYNMRNANNDFDTVKKALSSQIQNCWKHLIVPSQEIGDSVLSLDCLPINNNDYFIKSIENTCLENEFIIRKWAPVHLNRLINNIYWNNSKDPIQVSKIWQDSTKYIYFERLQDYQVLDNTIRQASVSADYFGIADGIDSDGKFLGLSLGKEVFQITDESVLVPLETAKKLLEEKKTAQQTNDSNSPTTTEIPSTLTENLRETPIIDTPSQTPTKKTHFYLEEKIPFGELTIKANKIYEEIISVLNQSPYVDLDVRISIDANFADGAEDNIVRAVSENLKTLKMNSGDWS